MWDYLRVASSCPFWEAMKNYVVIPDMRNPNKPRSISAREKIFAGDRKGKVFDHFWQTSKNIHFISKPAWNLRILEHFYTYIYFEDESMDLLAKRLVRDSIHYVDLIFCKAAIIIDKLKKEAEKSGGHYSSFHIRRGEFQYKEVKIPADQILANVGQFIPPKSSKVVYIGK